MNNFDKILYALHELHEVRLRVDPHEKDNYSFSELLDWSGGFSYDRGNGRYRTDVEWLAFTCEDIINLAQDLPYPSSLNCSEVEKEK